MSDTIRLEVFRDDEAFVGWCTVDKSRLAWPTLVCVARHDDFPIARWMESMPSTAALVSQEAYAFATMQYEDGRCVPCVRLAPDQDPKHLPKWKAL